MQLERWLFHLLGRLPAWGNVVRWFVNLEIAREPSQSTAKLATPHHHHSPGTDLEFQTWLEIVRYCRTTQRLDPDRTGTSYSTTLEAQ